MNFPVNFKNVIPIKTYYSVNDELHNANGWNLVNSSYENDNVNWGYNYKHDILSFYDASIRIKFLVKRVIHKDITLARIHVNGQTAGQHSSFHVDFDEDYFWTFVLFTAEYWDTSWGGEFICKDPFSGEYKYTPYIPNNGVLIPSNWEHVGCCPNFKTDKLRTSLAFTYIDNKYLDYELKKNTIPRLFL